LFDLLMGRFGSLDAIFAVSASSLHAIDDLEDDRAEQIRQAETHLGEAQAEYDRLRERDIRIVTRLDAEYPRRFEELNDPPPLLYVRGSLPANDRKAVTLAGASDATAEGIELTVDLARRFAADGVQVVASLRRGIDAAAHLGARAAEQGSFAVIESGLDRIDAAEQLPVAIDALRGGGVLSELAPDQGHEQGGFAAANRLLAGLSNAVVVTEIYADSREALDLVEFCSQIGKLVFIVAHHRLGPLSDSAAMDRLTEYGAVPLDSPEQADQIIAALV